MNDRGMKKWIPFKSLIEQDIELKKYRLNKEKIERPIVLEDKACEINDFLVNYNDNTAVVEYFYDGYIVRIVGIIKKIDLNDRSIIIDDDTKIKLIDLLDVYYQI